MISKPVKLTYEEVTRFPEQGSLEQKKQQQQFTMNCPCGEKFAVPLDILGNFAACPKCGSNVKISDEDFMPLTCGCGKSLRIPKCEGVKTCPSCKKPVKLLTMQAAQNDSETKSPEKAAPEKKPEIDIPAVLNEAKIEPPKKFELNLDDLDTEFEQPKKESVKVRCSCGQKLAVPAEISHKSIECPRCHHRFKIPH